MLTGRNKERRTPNDKVESTRGALKARESAHTSWQQPVLLFDRFLKNRPGGIWLQRNLVYLRRLFFFVWHRVMWSGDVRFLPGNNPPARVPDRRCKWRSDLTTKM